MMRAQISSQNRAKPLNCCPSLTGGMTHDQERSREKKAKSEKFAGDCIAVLFWSLLSRASLMPSS